MSGIYKWSNTADSNASADPTVNWAEGQAPASINNSARAMMASTANYVDDNSGGIITTGSSTAYTVSSFQAFDSATNMNGNTIAFSPHVTCGANPTLLVDGLGPYPLLSSSGTGLAAGALVQGAPYVAVFNKAANAWYMRNFYGATGATASFPTVRYGTAVVTNGSTVTVTFSTPFPSTCSGLVATANFNTSVSPNINVYSLTASNFGANCLTPGNTSSFVVGFSYWGWGS